MKRTLAAAAFCCATLPARAAVAPDLDAVLLHESTTVSADGVTRSMSYREKMVRRDGHVWTERMRPAAARDGHGHDHESGPAHAHVGHKHFDYASAARHVTNVDGKVDVEYVDAAGRIVVSVPPAEFESTGFDGSWDNAFYVTPPSQLKQLAGNSKAPAKPSGMRGVRRYEQKLASAGTHGVNRILWSDALQAPLSVEYRSADGRVVRKLTLTPVARAESLPWRQLDGYARKEYTDFLD